MMVNLFSIFDPSGIMSFNGWFMMPVCLALLPMSKFSFSCALSVFSQYLISSLKIELDTPLVQGVYSNKTKGLISLFMFIVIMNILGLTPYVFTPTSHIIIPLSLAIPMWLSLYSYGWVVMTYNSFAHLVPVGTPGLLMPFMVLIETISAVIRPVTLSIRLVANMVAGHLLLSLTSGAISSVLSFIPLFSAQLVLLMLEIAVAFIQGYVFMILMTLYIKEVFVN